jgi:ABC-type multidrug transport system ATPase subunit
MYALELEGIRRRYGDRYVLDDLNIHVPQGKIYGCLGRNGAGKTTAIRIVLGLIRRHAGEVRIGGKPVTCGDASALRHVGSVVEFPGFYPNLTGRENLRAFQMLRGGCETGELDRALDIAGLSGEAGKRVGGYSLGMKQRLGIARALLGDPALLILDEPTNGLDPAGMRDMRALLRTLAEQGRTIFLSSHILSEVQQIVDVVGIIRGGRMIEETGIAELSRRCFRGLRIGVGDPRRAAEILAGKGIQCVAGEREVLAQAEDAERVNRMLAENGLWASMLAEDAVSLEDYFLSATRESEGCI